MSQVMNQLMASKFCFSRTDTKINHVTEVFKLILYYKIYLFLSFIIV